MAAFNKSLFVFFGIIAFIAIVRSAPADTKNVDIFQRVRRSPQLPEPPSIPMPPSPPHPPMPLENGQRVARQAPPDVPEQGQRNQGTSGGPRVGQNMEHKQNRSRREAKGGGHMPTKTG